MCARGGKNHETCAPPTSPNTQIAKTNKNHHLNNHKKVAPALALLTERLRSESTRLAAVRAAAALAGSPLPLPALGGAAAGGVANELTGFLRKANR